MTPNEIAASVACKPKAKADPSEALKTLSMPDLAAGDDPIYGNQQATVIDDVGPRTRWKRQ